MDKTSTTTIFIEWGIVMIFWQIFNRDWETNYLNINERCNTRIFKP